MVRPADTASATRPGTHMQDTVRMTRAVRCGLSLDEQSRMTKRIVAKTTMMAVELMMKDRNVVSG